MFSWLSSPLCSPLPLGKIQYNMFVQGTFVCSENHQGHHPLCDDDADHHHRHLTSSPSDYLHCSLVIQNWFILVLGVVENKSREPVAIIVIIAIEIEIDVSEKACILSSIVGEMYNVSCILPNVWMMRGARNDMIKKAKLLIKCSGRRTKACRLIRCQLDLLSVADAGCWTWSLSWRWRWWWRWWWWLRWWWWSPQPTVKSFKR